MIQAKLLGAQFQERRPREDARNFTGVYYRAGDKRLFKMAIVDTAARLAEGVPRHRPARAHRRSALRDARGAHEGRPHARADPALRPDLRQPADGVLEARARRGRRAVLGGRRTTTTWSRTRRWRPTACSWRSTIPSSGACAPWIRRCSSRGIPRATPHAGAAPGRAHARDPGRAGTGRAGDPIARAAPHRRGPGRALGAGSGPAMNRPDPARSADARHGRLPGDGGPEGNRSATAIFRSSSSPRSRSTSCARCGPARGISSASRSSWPRCWRAFATCWKCACCTRKRRRLYDELVAEHKRLIELSAQPGAMVGVKKDERLVTPW